MKRFIRINLVLGLFILASCAVFAAPWKFAMFCDSRGDGTGVEGSVLGVRTSVLTAIAKAVAKEHVDCVIFPGDEVNGDAKIGTIQAQLTEWKKAMSPIYSAKIPVYGFRGNHENQQKDPITAWNSIFPNLPKNGPDGAVGLTYYVNHKNARFIGFDPYADRSPTYDSKAYDSVKNYGIVNPWVLMQIKDAPQPWVFVFSHEPAFIGHHTDCMANAPGERDALWDALGARHAVYMCGHDHMYLRHTAPDSKGNQVMELVVGTAGAPFYPLDKTLENAKYDREIVPTVQFVNADLDLGVNKNTNDNPPEFGYLIVTVNGKKAIGEWKGFTNYDYKNWIAPAHPVFKTLDRFEVTLP